ncbi:MAG: hypothetical protein AUJ52_01565 [Elusimicrobia bacterium CG1_02_63_36]|nr:MAG: hypothetical protein AUJ52_01565 [Elusimicrobia bacterium CG1_02_63_36]PJA14596.1 MAG: hypothetical protein COX66_12210 [Elusimicrobia bacterium CG_4_10_14_0_2_um_filter_63_34]
MRALALLFFISLPAEAGYFAAAGKTDITPDPSVESVYLAGYGASGKRAKGVRDRLYARALVVSDGTSTAALVSLDLIGLYRNDVLDLRSRTTIPVFVTATHTHSGPDTLGLWGPILGMSGVRSAYQERVKASVAALIAELNGKLDPAELFAARESVDPSRLCRDRRDPAAFDPDLDVLSVRRGNGQTIATGVRFSCHATALGRTRERISADYPGALCSVIEKAKGGTCLFFPGSIGGHIVPAVEIGATLEEQDRAMEDLGAALASTALGARYRPLSPGSIAFSSAVVSLPVENSRYLTFLPSLAFGHRLFDSAGVELPFWKRWWIPLRHAIFFPLPAALRPWVETEVSRADLGPLKILGIPGESFPEQAIGGYGGEHRYAQALIAPDSENPPVLERAPKPPYLRELLSAEYAWIVNLANDEIGYTIPAYDFQAAETRTMRPRPKGTHYGETNSIGPSATEIVMDAARELASR